MTRTILQHLLSLETVYVLTGLVLLVFAIFTFADHRHPTRIGSGCFWLILGIVFALGSLLPHAVTGVLVLTMVAIDGAGRVKPSANDAAKPEEARLGNRIFLPVLVIPLVTILFAAFFRLRGLDVTIGAVIGLGFGGIVAMFVAQRITGATLRGMFDDGRRLNECMGPVNILPQLLASLGVIFAAAGVGDVVAHAIQHIVPRDHLFLLIVANCLGMSLFTMVMGNSFAAFPVIAAGVLVPLIVKPFGVDPAMAGIITLTAGSSGTLITPMAANFNIVPAALLEMRRTDGVIRFQLPFALSIWPLHVLVMWVLIKVWG
jgi:uncharacterized membrane protein